MDKSRVEPSIFFIEKLSFSLKLFSGHFYGQSFIKTVRGPLVTLRPNYFIFIGYLKNGDCVGGGGGGFKRTPSGPATFID